MEALTEGIEEGPTTKAFFGPVKVRWISLAIFPWAVCQ